jgi:accessory gene regulator protein AgrB
LVADFLIKRGLQEEKKDIYVYAIEILSSNILTIIMSVAIGIMLNCFGEMCVYWIVFITMRENFQGYHFKKFYQCFVLSILCSVGSVIFSIYLGESSLAMLLHIMLGVSIVVTLVVAQRFKSMLNKRSAIKLFGVLIIVFLLIRQKNLHWAYIMENAILFSLFAHVALCVKENLTQGRRT